MQEWALLNEKSGFGTKLTRLANYRKDGDRCIRTSKLWGLRYSF